VTANNGRDKRGRFAAGNPGGPGRPRRETEAAYVESLAEACTPAKWKQICERAVEDAAAGDHRARTWLAAYLLGPPRLLEFVDSSETWREDVLSRALDELSTQQLELLDEIGKAIERETERLSAGPDAGTPDAPAGAAN
jgi:hypothetical protein